MCHSGMGKANTESEEVFCDSSMFVSRVTITPLSWVNLTPHLKKGGKQQAAHYIKAPCPLEQLEINSSLQASLLLISQYKNACSGHEKLNIHLCREFDWEL